MNTETINKQNWSGETTKISYRKTNQGFTVKLEDGETIKIKVTSKWDDILQEDFTTFTAEDECGLFAKGFAMEKNLKTEWCVNSLFGNIRRFSHNLPVSVAQIYYNI